ncbi:MAG: hypothetical protein WBF75_23825 [Pseudonocardiaceae bacterium]
MLCRLDRQLGAVVVHDELNTKIRQVQELTAYSLAPGTREALAALLSEMHTLAGWQARDLGEAKTSWQHHERARSAAAQSNSIPHDSHAVGEQAFVLIDAGATGDAVDLLDEALAAHGDHAASLRAFDRAADLLPSDPTDERPYCGFTPLHLARWSGHVLAQFGEPDATAVLTDALNQLDPSAVGAQARTHIDLATALATNGDRDVARTHANHATQLATQVGSARLRRRSTTLLTTLC